MLGLFPINCIAAMFHFDNGSVLVWAWTADGDLTTLERSSQVDLSRSFPTVHLFAFSCPYGH